MMLHFRVSPADYFKLSANLHLRRICFRRATLSLARSNHLFGYFHEALFAQIAYLSFDISINSPDNLVSRPIRH